VSAAVLELQDLVAGYDEADVLTGVSLRAEANRITCLLGANGAGKSTLIRTVLGLTPARRGRVLLDGEDITRLPTHRIIALGLACIPEGRRVFSAMTVEENLKVGAYGERSRGRIGERLGQIYEIFPRLNERASQLAGTLSGGEQAMLSIGRGMMGAPRLLLIDEPSLGLSPLYVKQNFRIIQRIHETGVTVLLVEQNVRQTLAIAHQGYVLAQGRISAAGDAASLSDNAEVRAAYFGR
jgi:branched-chain amino acid transport system ATP-binding protein